MKPICDSESPRITGSLTELTIQKVISGSVITMNKENMDLMFPNTARVTFQPCLPLDVRFACAVSLMFNWNFFTGGMLDEL